MTRKTAREIAVQLCFAAASSPLGMRETAEDFFEPLHFDSLKDEDALFAEYPDKSQLDYILRLLTLLEENLMEIDGCIAKASKGWRVERISKTALAILRCAVCEILYMDEIPDAAAINEAVELDKGYDEPETVAYVNGVLGGIMRTERPEPQEETAAPAETAQAQEE